MGVLQRQTVQDVPHGRRLLPVLVDELRPERIFARIPKSSHLQDGLIDVNCQTFARAINRAAGWLEDTLGKSSSFETVAYFGPSDLRYLIFVLGASKVGYKASNLQCFSCLYHELSNIQGGQLLLPSPRNSLEGQLSLLGTTDCKAILGPEGYNFQHGLLEKSNLPVFRVGELLDLLAEGEVRQYKFDKTFDNAKDDPIVVLHTSGSTGLPKPIVISHGWIASFDNQKNLGTFNGYPPICTAYFARRIFCSVPPFHAFGLMISLIIPLLSVDDCEIIFPPPGRPVSAVTIDEVLDCLEIDLLATAPSILEDVAQSQESLLKMKRVPRVVIGGGPLSREAGAAISKQTRVVNTMGATESCILPLWVSPAEDWQYFQYNPALKGLEFRPLGDGTYQQFLVRHPTTDPYHAAWKTFPHLQEYSMKDLYMKHPTKENLWFYVGRGDDLIVLSNGEKLNPTSMEMTLVGHNGVKGALVVGQARFAPAAMIELNDDISTRLRTAEERAAMIDEIWPSVMKANQSAPSHAQISRDRIFFSKPEKPFVRAGKLTIQRKATVVLYEEEIEEFYKHHSQETLEDIPHIDLTKDMDSVERALGGLIANAVGIRSLSADQDFFETGMDSLQVMKAVRGLEAALGSGYKGPITSQLIYSNTTVAALAAALTPGARANVPRKVMMEQTLRKYAAQLPESDKSLKEHATQPPECGMAVVLTGSTGSLGSYLLDALVSSRNVTKIYCLNRRPDAEQQQAKTNATRGLVSEWGDRVIFLHADLSKPNLGLAVQAYGLLRSEVTVIIHNQWPVNFNLALPSFEPHIAGSLNLIRLSSESYNNVPIFFTSSIGALRNWPLVHPGVPVPEVALDDPLIPTQQGYSESKWITERLLDAARERCGVSGAILRVGQIAGPVNVKHGKHGAWNKQEWLPTIINSSLYLRVLPDSLGGQDDVAWVPVDILAEILTELIFNDCLLDKNEANSPWTRYYHLANPYQVKWSTLAPVILDYFGKERLRSVSLHEWVKILEVSGKEKDADAARNPGLKLLEMFRGLTTEEESLILDTKHTQERSTAMQNLKPVNPEWMRLWLEQWAF